MPERVQLSRSKGWKMPANTRKVDRSTIFGNPFSIETFGKEKALALYRSWINGTLTDEEIRNGYHKMIADLLINRRKIVVAAIPQLIGKNLGCWCPLPEQAAEVDRCHATVLLELANRELVS